MSKTTTISGVAACALAILACGSTYAADNARDYADYPHSYIAILPGYFYANKGHDATHNGATLSGIFGYQFAPQWEVEGNVFFTNIITHRDRGVSNFYQQGLTLDIAYNLFGTDRRSFTPFVIGGVGGVYDDMQPSRYGSMNFQADAGLGFVTGALMDHGLLAGLKIRAEARYLYDRLTSPTQTGMSDARASVGIEIPLGTASAPPPPPPVEPARVMQEPVVQEAPPPPPPLKVTHCATSFPGARVDQNGCAIAPQTVVLHDIHFATNQATLRPGAQNLLDSIVAAMKAQPSMTVQIAGYTDNVGSPSYNVTLSQQRADAARGYLVAHGIDRNRMSTIGYGETDPVATPQNTDAARARNRRVEFTILTP